MKLSVKDMDISTGGILIALLNMHDAEMLDLFPGDRIRVGKGKKSTVVIVDIAESGKACPRGKVGLFEEVLDKIDAKHGDTVTIDYENKPESIKHIKRKLNGGELTPVEIRHIVDDLVCGTLTDIELTYYVAANYTHGMTKKETVALTKAMIETGDWLTFPEKKIIVDKHCIGGVAGNRTTMAVVPIVAAAGLFVPKTSSRSITSPAGTADTMEALANVSMDIKKIKRVLKKVGACIAWGGAINLAPADDIIIKVEHPLSVDPEGQLLASIMAKKGSVSATHLLIDIPIGRGAKLGDRKQANHLKKEFESIGAALGMKVCVVITDGSQPIGKGIGPVLEARDLMWMLKNDPRQPYDLRRKSVFMAGKVFEMTGLAKSGQGEKMAEEILHSGKAYKKMWDIIIAQGARIRSTDDLRPAKLCYDVQSPMSGKITHIDNNAISKIARLAGCPETHGAGLYLYHHVGDYVKKGDVLFTIYANVQEKLDYAMDAWKRLDGVEIDGKPVPGR